MYYINNPNYTDSVKAYETIYNILKTMVPDISFQLIYTGSNSLLLRGWPLERKIKDHDFVIQVFEESAKDVISNAFTKWCEKFPTHTYYIHSYPGDKKLHGNIKLTCELNADLFIIDEFRNFDEFPNTANHNNPFYIAKIKDVFDVKFIYDSNKAFRDAFELIKVLNIVLGNSNEKKSNESPF